MDEINTVSDMMKSYANQKPADVKVRKSVERQRLQPTSRYAFCPYCATNARKQYGAEWKNHIQPLWYEKFKLLVTKDAAETEGLIIYEDTWNCDNCHRKITEDDYVKVYSKVNAPTKKTIDLTKVDITDPNFIANF